MKLIYLHSDLRLHRAYNDSVFSSKCNNWRKAFHLAELFCFLLCDVQSTDTVDRKGMRMISSQTEHRPWNGITHLFFMDFIRVYICLGCIIKYFIFKKKTKVCQSAIDTWSIQDENRYGLYFQGFISLCNFCFSFPGVCTFSFLKDFFFPFLWRFAESKIIMQKWRWQKSSKLVNKKNIMEELSRKETITKTGTYKEYNRKTSKHAEIAGELKSVAKLVFICILTSLNVTFVLNTYPVQNSDA